MFSPFNRSKNTIVRLPVATSISFLQHFPQPRISTFRFSSHSTLLTPNDDLLFKNTSRRWIFNEERRMAERYIEFKPTELQRVAAKALGRDWCPHINKLAEGGFNKIFLLAADDGSELIARVPTPIAGPPHYTTASEVATINFLRDVLKLPVPKILDYSASSDNPVGAEYILMERVDGESLPSRWLSLTTNELKHIMTQLVEIEHRIFSFQFPGYGSLYHEADIKNEPHKALEIGDFHLGPVAKRQFWHDERRYMNLDRGPWTLAEDCLTSAARREVACLLGHAKPRPRKTFLLPTEYNIDPKEHMSLLSQFIQLAPFLVPSQSSLSAPTLRHPDLSAANILLHPGSTKIASIIDWQDASIFPLFIQAGYPAFCEHDSSRPQGLQVPTLPENFDKLSPQDQIQAKAKFRLEEANLYYTAATGIYNEEHLKALQTPNISIQQYLIQQTGYPWDGDIINLRAALVGITTPQVWNTFSVLPCPTLFSDEEREKALKESAEWNESEALLGAVRKDLGIDLEGGTEIENYDWAFSRNQQFRMEMVRQAEVHERETIWRNWPYKDDEDISPPPAIFG